MYMSANLSNYKTTTISKMVNDFNSYVKQQQVQLNNLISYIRSLRINNAQKNNSINSNIRIVNNSINKRRVELNNNIKAINALTRVPGERQPNKYALLIGINYKGASNELYGCINDTKNIQILLQEKYGLNNCVILTDDTTKKPTKQNIIKSFTDLLVNSISGDSLFLLYSGHGSYTTDLNKDELDGKDEVIVPIDATNLQSCILDDELNNIIKQNLKPNVKLFALFDSCYSGTVLDLKYNYLDSDNYDNLTTNTNITETVSPIIMISGSSDKQTSSDAFIRDDSINMYAGAMTFSFINTIKTKGASIPFKILLQEMRRHLKENGFTQTPQISSGTTIDINTNLVSI